MRTAWQPHRWPTDRHHRRPRVRTLVAAVLTALTAALGPAACTTAQGGVDGDLRRAAEGAAAATATAQLAVELLADGRTTGPAADTSVEDALAESQAAEVAAATLTVATPAEADARRRTLDAVHRATVALVEARTWVSEPELAAPSPAVRLARVTAELDALAAELGGAP